MRVALVTGGSKGIGYAIANALAMNGIALVLVARNEADLATAKESLEKHNVPVQAIAVDLTKNDSYTTIRDFIKDTFGQLDILVNNAGDFKQIPVEKDGVVRDAPADIAFDVEHMFSTNVKAASVFQHTLQPLLLRSKHPQQLDVLSSAAVEIFSGNNPYGLTKVAHERLSLSTVADSKGHIRTYRVYPSNTDTRIVKHFDVPKLTPEQVGNAAVQMMLAEKGTDLYMKMGPKGLLTAMFSIDYSKYVHDPFDGLGLVSDHRALIRTHFEPLLSNKY